MKKKLISLVLVLALLCGCSNGLVLTAFAEETEPTGEPTQFELVCDYDPQYGQVETFTEEVYNSHGIYLGASVYVNITPAQGYVIDESHCCNYMYEPISGDFKLVDVDHYYASDSYKHCITALTKRVILHVGFKPTPEYTEHSINLVQTEGGSISISTTSGIEGDLIQLYCEPEYQLRLGSWNVEASIEVGVSSLNTFRMPDEDVTVSAIFVRSEILDAKTGDSADTSCYEIKACPNPLCEDDVLYIKRGSNLLIDGGSYSHIYIENEYEGRLTLRNVTVETSSYCPCSCIEADTDSLTLAIDGTVNLSSPYQSGIVVRTGVLDLNSINIHNHIEQDINDGDLYDGDLSIVRSDSSSEQTLNISAGKFAIRSKNLDISGVKVEAIGYGNERVGFDCMSTVRVSEMLTLQSPGYLYAVNYGNGPALHSAYINSNVYLHTYCSAEAIHHSLSGEAEASLSEDVYGYDGHTYYVDEETPARTLYLFPKYEITFNANGGSVNGKAVYKLWTSGYECRIKTLPKASRSGYTFKGWQTASGKAVSANYTFSENTTVSAIWTKNSSSPSHETYTPTVTPSASETKGLFNVEVSGTKLAIKADIQGSVATVQEIDPSQSDIYPGPTANIVFDFSKVVQKLDTIIIPSSLTDRLSKAPVSSLTIKLKNGALIYEGKALASINGQIASGAQLKIRFIDSGAVLNDEQKSAISEMDTKLILDIYMTCDSKRIYEFGGGTVRISVPAASVSAAPSELSAWHLSELGELTQLPLVQRNSNYEFDVTHFSNYVLSAGSVQCSRDAACPVNKFADADASQWYHDGVHYMAANGYMQGYTQSFFGTDDILTRAQVTEIMYRIAKANGRADERITASLNYPDASLIPDYAREAVLWATQNHIVNGFEDGYFRPDWGVSDLQLAILLDRFADYMDYANSGLGDFDIDMWVTKIDAIIEDDKRNLRKQLLSRAAAASVIARFLAGAE